MTLNLKLVLLSDIASDHQDLATHIAGSTCRYWRLDLDLLNLVPRYHGSFKKAVNYGPLNYIYLFLVMRTIAEF